MNDRDLENLLANMPLAPPSADLDERIRADAEAATRESADAVDTAADIGPIRGPWTVRRTIGLAGSIAAALVVAVLIALQVGQPPEAPHTGQPDPAPISSSAEVEPIRQDAVVTEVTDAGVIFLDEETPVRRINSREIRRVQWIDGNRYVLLETTIPREETWLVPVDYD